MGTYSRVWGSREAVLVWFGALLLSATAASIAASKVHRLLGTPLIVGFALVSALEVGFQFLRKPTTTLAKAIQLASAAWVLLVHLCLGPLPLLSLHAQWAR